MIPKQALETSAETVKRALDQAVHEIFVAAMIGVEKLLRIDLDATQGPVSLVRQVLDRLPEGVPAFGRTAGFVVNYSPTRQSGSIQTSNQSQFRIRPPVQGPPFFSVLGGVRSLPKHWGWFSVNRQRWVSFSEAA
jgi:hypothetical protein